METMLRTTYAKKTTIADNILTNPLLRPWKKLHSKIGQNVKNKNRNDMSENIHGTYSSNITWEVVRKKVSSELNRE